MAGVTSQTSTSNLWDLSLYELHRKPHDMVSDTTVIAVSPRAVHSELMCPICLDLMRNTQTTKECLHRFCQECIITALRSGNKECPTCRKKLVSKRSLRPDPNFDALIAKIYPNREELNAQQERQSSRRSIPLPRRKRKALETPPIDGNVPHPPETKRRKPTGSEQGSPAPSSAPPTRTPTPTPTPTRTPTRTPTPSPQLTEQVKPDEEVELQIRPLPAVPSIAEHAIRNLVTSPICTISHLIKYLSINQLLEKEVKEKGSAVRALKFNENQDHGVIPAKDIMLFAQLGSSNDYCALPGGTSLQQIVEMYWTPGDKLKLFFSIGQHSTTTTTT